MKIMKQNTPNQNKGRNGQVPIMIVCHRTCGKFDGAVSWLCNSKSGASSHFVVSKDGRVVQLVDIENTAWCNGTSTNSTNAKYHKHSILKYVRGTSRNANDYSISIEFEGMSDESGELTEIQQKIGIELIQFIIDEVKRIYGYEILVSEETIVGHCHITPKWKPNCPGAKFPFKDIVNELNKEDYMPEKREFVVNGEVKELNGILFGNKNYVELRELEKLGLKVGYDKNKKLATVDNK